MVGLHSKNGKDFHAKKVLAVFIFCLFCLLCCTATLIDLRKRTCAHNYYTQQSFDQLLLPTSKVGPICLMRQFADKSCRSRKSGMCDLLWVLFTPRSCLFAGPWSPLAARATELFVFLTLHLEVLCLVAPSFTAWRTACFSSSNFQLAHLPVFVYYFF